MRIRIQKKGWLILFTLTTIIGCSEKIISYSNQNAFKSESGVPNYSSLEYWAAHPEKWDPSDSIPKPLQNGKYEKKVDVFFVHPTTLTALRDTIYTNARIDDSVINYKTDYSSMLYQASAFNERAKIYAPRYRQAHIQMYFSKDTAKMKAAFELAYQDVKRAFEYYLKNYNNGRPIILASHSQGTTHTMRLLREYFDNKPLAEKLVCAYIIGMGVEKKQFTILESCKNPEQIGCYNSWRTFRYNYHDEFINKKDTSIAVVNPITWKMETTRALKSEAKGAVLYNFNKIFKNTQDAWVEGNALWITHPHFPGSVLYRTKNYHIGDINLFYVDVREDVSRRISIYLNKNQVKND